MKTIAVTGCGAGMGLAIRRRLEADGHRVLGVDRPGQGSEVEADLSTAQGRRHAVERVLTLCGGLLDGLVCNAGVDVPNPSLTFQVNYLGVVEVMDGLRPALAQAPAPAAVVNVSNSIHITPNIPMQPVEALLAGDLAGAERLLVDDPHKAYQVSKFAVARWLRRIAPSPEWAGAGIRVNGICPGPVKTSLLEKDLADPEKSRAILALPQPLGEWTTPEAVADVAACLLGPQARFLVGQLLMVDGGLEALLRAEAVPSAWCR